MNDAVEITTNQFQQNISIKLADDYLSTLLTGNVMKFSVGLTKIFNSEFYKGVHAGIEFGNEDFQFTFHQCSK